MGAISYPMTSEVLNMAYWTLYLHGYQTQSRANRNNHAPNLLNNFPPNCKCSQCWHSQVLPPAPQNESQRYQKRPRLLWKNRMSNQESERETTTLSKLPWQKKKCTAQISSDDEDLVSPSQASTPPPHASIWYQAIVEDVPDEDDFFSSNASVCNETRLAQATTTHNNSDDVESTEDGLSVSCFVEVAHAPGAIWRSSVH